MSKNNIDIDYELATQLDLNILENDLKEDIYDIKDKIKMLEEDLELLRRQYANL